MNLLLIPRALMDQTTRKSGCAATIRRVQRLVRLDIFQRICFCRADSELIFRAIV